MKSVGAGPLLWAIRRVRGLLRRLPSWDSRALREGRRPDFAVLLRLAGVLAFVAGALNAGGFQALGFYTSHVTGNLSRTANEWMAGHLGVAASFGVLVCMFMAGAFTTGLLQSYGMRHRHRARQAFSLGLEALLLSLFGVTGDAMAHERLFAPATAILLTFVMGMHNGISSTLADTEVRTTHMTGNTTDLGLGLSKLLYANRAHSATMKSVVVDRRRLALHATVVLCFFGGAILGALVFARWGYVCALPLAAVLGALSLPALAQDAEVRLRLRAFSRGA